jgi:hypothetical protein
VKPALRVRVVFSICLVLASLVVGYWYLRPETAKEAARKVLLCMEVADGGCVLPYVHEREVMRFDLTAAKLSGLLELTTSRIARAAQSKREIEYTVEPKFGFAVAARRYVLGSRQIGTVSVKVSVTENRLTCSPVVSQAIRDDLVSLVSSQGRKPEELPVLYAEALSQRAPFYRKLGFDGAINETAFGPFESWDAKVARYRQVAAKMAANAATQQPAHGDLP